MTTPNFQAITEIQSLCTQMAQLMMKVHPQLTLLESPTTKAECVIHLHHITVELESIKKKIKRLHQDTPEAL
jgi:hypothetical protein